MHKNTFEHDSWWNHISWDLAPCHFPLRGAVPQGKRPRASCETKRALRSRKACSLRRMRKWERMGENNILVHCEYNGAPMRSWHQARICIMLSLFTKLFHMIHLILKTGPWNTINGVICLILQLREQMLSEVKWLTCVQVLVQQRQA